MIEVLASGEVPSESAPGARRDRAIAEEGTTQQREVAARTDHPSIRHPILVERRRIELQRPTQHG